MGRLEFYEKPNIDILRMDIETAFLNPSVLDTGQDEILPIIELEEGEEPIAPWDPWDPDDG